VQLPITIGLHRSRLIDTLVVLCAGLASLAIVFFPVSPVQRGALLIVAWGSAWLAWRQGSLKLSALRLERDGQISIRRAGSPEFTAAELLPGANVHPWLTVCRLKTGADEVLSLVVTRDSLDEADFRRLRVFLRWQAEFSGRGDAA